MLDEQSVNEKEEDNDCWGLIWRSTQSQSDKIVCQNWVEWKWKSKKASLNVLRASKLHFDLTHPPLLCVYILIVIAYTLVCHRPCFWYNLLLVYHGRDGRHCNQGWKVWQADGRPEEHCDLPGVHVHPWGGPDSLLPKWPPFVPSLPARNNEGKRKVAILPHMQGAHGEELEPDCKDVDWEHGARVHERGVQRNSLPPRVGQAQTRALQV